MIRKLLIFCFIFVFLSQLSNAKPDPDSFDKFNYKNLDGKEISFSKYKGKCILVVNTASGCSLTTLNMGFFNEIRSNPKYKALEIAAFPSNDFGQEHIENNEKLKSWFFDEWKVQYDVYAPISVKNSDIFNFLTKKSKSSVHWNYTRFLVHKDGKTVESFVPNVKFFSGSLIRSIEKCLSSSV